MKIPLVLTLILVAFGAGFMVGSRHPGEAVATPAPPARPEDRARRPLPSPGYQPDPVLPERIATATYQERAEILKQIDPAHRLAHLAQLLSRSGPDGLDYPLKSAISTLLEEAMADSREETIQWVLAQEHIGYRDHLLGEILGNEDHEEWVAENFDSLLARLQTLENPHKTLKSLIGTKRESDPAEAIRLSKALLVDHEGRIDYPGLLQEKAVEHGWQTAFEYYKDSWTKKLGSSGWSWVGEFPDDFDFSNFAAAWREHEAGLGLGERGGFYQPPKALWKAWARHDPEAAFAYLQSDATTTFEIDDFFDGYEEVAEPADLFDFSRSLLSGEGGHQQDLASELHSYLAGDPVRTRDFVNWTAGSGDRSLLTSVLGTISAHSQGSPALARTLLTALPPDQRLATIREAHTRRRSDGSGSYYLGESQLETFTGILTELGHAPSEITEALTEK